VWRKNIFLGNYSPAKRTKNAGLENPKLVSDSLPASGLERCDNGRPTVEFRRQVTSIGKGESGDNLAPQLAAIGAIAALVTRCTVVVEKVTEQVEE